MTFRQAIEQTPHLQGAWKDGLQALRAVDKLHIKPEDTRKLRGSADIDGALQATEPNANRWDFAIGYQQAPGNPETVYWVETHSGTDEEIKVVLRKLDWLQNWLRRDGHRLAEFKGGYYWVPSGATEFTRGSQEVRQLAQQGLIYSGSTLRIPR